MSNSLPDTNFFEDFYIWFDKYKKEEYYATPLYHYKTSFTPDYDNKMLTLYWNEDEKTDNGLKFPANAYYPFHEKLGLLLLRFLNANFKNFDSAYKDFFFAYGFEILKDLNGDYKFEMKNNYGSDEAYLKAVKKIYNDLKEDIIAVQLQFIHAITYIYNTGEIEKLEKYTYTQRYAVYLIKQLGQLHKYNKNNSIIKDSYSNKYLEFYNDSAEQLLDKIYDNPLILSMNDTHKSNDLSSICYAILEEIAQMPNYPIKKCKNCGMYFIPNSRLDEIYCDYPKPLGKTCRERGAMLSYQNRLKEKTPYGEYRKLYQQKFIQVRKDKENKQLAKDFDKWKKQAKEQINKLKHKEISEEEMYKWLKENQ